MTELKISHLEENLSKLEASFAEYVKEHKLDEKISAEKVDEMFLTLAELTQSIREDRLKIKALEDAPNKKRDYTGYLMVTAAFLLNLLKDWVVPLFNGG